MDKKKYAASDVLKFIHHLKSANDIGKSFINSRSEVNLFAIIFKQALPKLEWIYNQFITSHLIYQHIPDTIPFIKEKWEADATMELALVEKISLLNNDQQETLETIIDCLIAGEKINIEVK